MLTTGGTIGQYANIVHGWDMDGNVARLGYFFGTLTPKVPASTVQSEILRALNAWSAVTNVVFSPAASATAVRTIMIEFASGAHGDAYPFDSAGEVLAHTFYPVPLNSESLAGDMHFNSSVNWHSGSDIDIYSVALHELGHALGLGHTDTPGDVMYPYYRRGMTLSAHDIGAVQTLYGAPGAAPTQAGDITTTPAPAAPTKTTPAPTTPTTPAPAAPAATPVSLTLNAIASPGTGAQVSISGTVKGGTAPWTVSWQTDHGYTGKATVASNGTWTATGITLVVGANTVTATVFDSANKTASESATVTRQQASTMAPSAGPMSIHITSPSSRGGYSDGHHGFTERNGFRWHRGYDSNVADVGRRERHGDGCGTLGGIEHSAAGGNQHHHGQGVRCGHRQRVGFDRGRTALSCAALKS